MTAMTANKPAPRLSSVPSVSDVVLGLPCIVLAVSSAMTGMTVSSSNKPAVLIHILFLQPFYAFTRADHIRQADTEFVVDHDHLAMSYKRAVDQHVQWLSCQSIQLDNRALIQLQKVADRDLGIPHFHRDTDGDVQNDIEIRWQPVALSRHRAPIKLLHRSRSHAANSALACLFTFLPGLFHGLGPLIVPGLFCPFLAGLFHGRFPFSCQLFVLAQLLPVFVVVSHCVLP